MRRALAKPWQGRPMSLFDEEPKAYFLAAGYAVATIDVRASQWLSAAARDFSCVSSADNRQRLVKGDACFQLEARSDLPTCVR